MSSKTQTAPSVRRDRHRHGIPAGDAALLALPEAQATIARIAASVDPDYGDRAAHIKRVATLAIRARLRPTNKFAQPTLFIAHATTTGPDADRTSQRVGAS